MHATTTRLILTVLCLGLPMGLAFHGRTRAEENEPDVIVIAAAENPRPEVLPTLRVVQPTTYGEPYPTMVSARFPNVPDFQCDSWCYESELDFVDARPLDGGCVEMRHRVRSRPGELVITVVTPEPGAIEFVARMAPDTEGYPQAQVPEHTAGLNLCWQLRHCPGFKSKPDPYPEFIKRCFIFTEKGRTFLLDTDRRKIPCRAPDDERNNPPWVQSYCGVWQPVPKAGPDSWADYSTDRYITTVIGCVSRDGKYLAAVANDSASSMHQAWHDCMHNNPQWLPADAPTAERRWRLKVYAMANDPDALLTRVGNDFPNAKHLGSIESVPAEREAE
ncbi:MAG TPA: hypothetical protein HPP77_01180 [Candidatus Hydrogenedentes bacterium]|nr:hypothetical protein [Candidatus Hydrogenedentota bacterium]